MPAGATWLTLLGVSICAGIGFTMSLFIGSLAFEDPAFAAPLRLGVLVGSLLSAAVGYLVVRVATWSAPSAAPSARVRFS
jgi:NhaA family Na+:H+ antiporter